MAQEAVNKKNVLTYEGLKKLKKAGLAGVLGCGLGYPQTVP